MHKFLSKLFVLALFLTHSLGSNLKAVLPRELYKDAASFQLQEIFAKSGFLFSMASESQKAKEFVLSELEKPDFLVEQLYAFFRSHIAIKTKHSTDNLCVKALAARAVVIIGLHTVNQSIQKSLARLYQQSLPTRCRRIPLAQSVYQQLQNSTNLPEDLKELLKMGCLNSFLNEAVASLDRDLSATNESRSIIVATIIAEKNIKIVLQTWPGISLEQLTIELERIISDQSARKISSQEVINRHDTIAKIITQFLTQPQEYRAYDWLTPNEETPERAAAFLNLAVSKACSVDPVYKLQLEVLKV